MAQRPVAGCVNGTGPDHHFVDVHEHSNSYSLESVRFASPFVVDVEDIGLEARNHLRPEVKYRN